MFSVDLVYYFSRVYLLGSFDFEKNPKFILCLFSTAETKMKISISVQHQDSCSFMGRRISLSRNDNVKVNVKTIDNLYVILHARIR